MGGCPGGGGVAEGTIWLLTGVVERDIMRTGGAWLVWLICCLVGWLAGLFDWLAGWTAC
jgi:hypothetical protein